MYTISYPSGTIRRDGVIIPPDERDQAYQDYAAWLAQDNGPTVLEDTQEERPRIEVSAWQIRKALNQSGLRQAVEDAVAASSDQELKDGWEYAPVFYSDNPLSLGLGESLGKTKAGMYELFLLAKTL